MEYSNLRVPAMVNRLSNTTPRERPSLPKLNYHSNELHTHNNNQPFSYTKSGLHNQNQFFSERNLSSNTTNSYATLDRKLLKSPKEVIYAQVVVSDTDQDGNGTGRNGLHKRTVHTTFNGYTPIPRGIGHTHTHTEPLYRNSFHNIATASDPDRDIIEHYVYKKRNGNKENLRNSNFNSSASPISNFPQDFAHHNRKPRNVTTVLINNNEDDNYNIKSAATRTNELFSSYRTARVETPDRERQFYPAYGDSPSNLNLHQQNSNSSSPAYYQFDSSRSPSPSPILASKVPSAKLVREADKIRDRDSFLPSAKLVNTFSPGPYNRNNHQHQTHTDYSYMTSKLGSGMKNRNDDYVDNDNDNDDSIYHRYNIDKNHRTGNIHQHQHITSYKSSYNTGPDPDVVDMKLLGNSTLEKRDRTKEKSPPKSGFSNHNNSLEKIYNNKNTIDSNSNTKLVLEKEDTNKMTVKSEKTNSTNQNQSSGFISTLLRRNKDKHKSSEINKEKKSDLIKDEEKEGKIKRQRAKFLSVFLEKNFTSKKNNEKRGKDINEHKHINGINRQITDSEIEEVERRRDGEYHSWSSGDDFYRFQNKSGLNRGHSYNFGEYKMESELSNYDHNDRDYRRNLATTPRYTSVTLGRPSGHPPKNDEYNDSIAFRSKSLDRRAFRNKYDNSAKINNSVPKIVITPNSPPVDATNKWNSSYEIHKNSTKHGQAEIENDWARKEFSKSTAELGSRSGERNGNLRYFGDTDMEDMSTYGRRSAYDNSNNNNNSTLTHGTRGSNTNIGKLQSSKNSTTSTSQMYQNQNGYNTNPTVGKHVSRKDSTLRFQKVPGGPFTRNSSESDNERSGSSQRSVYLHAPAVASIPTTLPKRTMSRDEISNYSGHQKQTRHLARSMSVLSPWRPRHYQEKYELNYNSNGVRADGGVSRPPRLPRSPVQKSVSPAPVRESSNGKENKNHSFFSKNKQSNAEKISAAKQSSISRSKSMPKNSRLGSWFSRKRNNGGTAGEAGLVK